jgi:nucleoid DNA-binding protein
MQPVTRDTIAKAVSDATLLCRQDVDDVVNQTIDYIAQSLMDGRDVHLRRFGIFEFRVRSARVRHNPQNTSEKVEVPAHFVVVFRPVEKVKRAVRKLTNTNNQIKTTDEQE